MRRSVSVSGIMIAEMGRGFLVWMGGVSCSSWVFGVSVSAFASAILKSISWKVSGFEVLEVRSFVLVSGVRRMVAVSKLRISSSKIMVSSLLVCFSFIVNVNSSAISGGWLIVPSNAR